ncbi:MAG: hypothetical protein HOQ45_24670 [Nocardioidaceae bacterium]|nr:hypothetical protein [Nocardioidaceae bacterium]
MAAPLLMLAGALVFPVLVLVFLLWLAELEDTLHRDVERSRRRPAPPPILAMPVRRPVPVVVRIPEQRTAPAVEVVDGSVPQGALAARRLPLGG